MVQLELGFSECLNLEFSKGMGAHVVCFLNIMFSSSQPFILLLDEN